MSDNQLDDSVKMHMTNLEAIGQINATTCFRDVTIT